MREYKQEQEDARRERIARVERNNQRKTQQLGAVLDAFTSVMRQRSERDRDDDEEDYEEQERDAKREAAAYARDLAQQEEAARLAAEQAEAKRVEMERLAAVEAERLAGYDSLVGKGRTPAPVDTVASNDNPFAPANTSSPKEQVNPFTVAALPPDRPLKSAAAAAPRASTLGENPFASLADSLPTVPPGSTLYREATGSPLVVVPKSKADLKSGDGMESIDTLKCTKDGVGIVIAACEIAR